MDLIPSDSPTLRAPARPVTLDELPALKAQASEIAAFMKSRGGAGLAGPQVGDARRWCMVRDAMLVNPVITDRSFLQTPGWEGCLSFPGQERRMMRHTWVDVEYLDLDGNRQTRTYRHFEARICQHECNHLDGICIVPA